MIPVVLKLIEDADSPLPDALRNSFHEVCLEIRDVERQLEALSKQIPTVGLLRTIPGVGLLTATALVALVGERSPIRLSTSHKLVKEQQRNADTIPGESAPRGPAPPS